MTDYQKYKTFFENGEMYAQFFLFNNDMNNAGDPINFKIYPENNEKIAKSFIGRPYVLPEKDDLGEWKLKHHRAEDLNTLFTKQQKFAAGEIVDVHQNRRSGNYNAIVKVFPEYYDQFRKGDIPGYTSPMFAHSESKIDEDGKMHVYDGIGVHLQGVTSPGYSPEHSSIMSICENGLNECMTELKTVAASGQLLEFQDSKRFSNDEKTSDSTMSQQQMAPQEGQQQGDAEARIGALEKGLAELTQQMAAILQKLGVGQAGQPQQAPPAQVGAAGEMEEPEAIKEVRAELEGIKADYEAKAKEVEAEKLALFMKDRTQTATEIVEAKIKLHKIPLENKEVEIKRLVELKEGDNFVPLGLLHSEVIDTLKGFVGASGDVQVFELPELGADDNKPTQDYASLMEEL